MLLLDEVDIEDMGIGWAAREGIMMRTRNHLKTDAETKGESDEYNQPGECCEKPATDTDSILCVVRCNTK